MSCNSISENGVAELQQEYAQRIVYTVHAVSDFSLSLCMHVRSHGQYFVRETHLGKHVEKASFRIKKDASVVVEAQGPNHGFQERVPEYSRVERDSERFTR
jgi:hypothetical protein